MNDSFEAFTEALLAAMSGPFPKKRVYRNMPLDWPKDRVVKPKATVYVDLDYCFTSYMRFKRMDRTLFFCWVETRWLLPQYPRFERKDRFTVQPTRGWEMVPGLVLRKMIEDQRVLHVEQRLGSDLDKFVIQEHRVVEQRLRRLEKSFEAHPNQVTEAWKGNR